MAKAFTGAATRRSELPSRSTGFTAEPITLIHHTGSRARLLSRCASIA
eukprot:SAG25_NODE_1040_length_4198_cov_15.883407_1_plen_48_part_00